ncbi:MAG TPA: hypothetical protein VFC44_05260 [Candidatus Saccharimonadales bacterium]|nr:hypothetical protein [Candidatus Saccharimonadales bacterium]
MTKSNIAALCSVVLFLAGCTTPQSMDYQPGISAGTERVGRTTEAEIAVDPFVDSARSKKFFRLDAMDAGIAILHVRIVNKTADQTLLVKKDNFHLLRTGGEVSTGNLDNGKDAAPGQIIGAIGIGSLMGILGATMVAHATQIQMNFTSKELGDQTLSPGQSTEGFVYFAPVKHGEDWTRATVVQVKLLPTRNQPPIEIVSR